MLQQALRTDKQKAVFEHSNDLRSSREVARLADVGSATFSRLWNEWLALGMCVESPNRTGRAQHLAPLSSLGLDGSSVVGPSQPASSDENGKEVTQ